MVKCNNVRVKALVVIELVVLFHITVCSSSVRNKVFRSFRPTVFEEIAKCNRFQALSPW